MCLIVRSRADALTAIAAERFDVLVIGGGSAGAGAALEAVSRGYRVAQADYASGTSSRWSKLVHGGLRDLENFDLGLVGEALLERRLMVRLAPHLVRPLPMIVPAFAGDPGRQRDQRDGRLGRSDRARRAALRGRVAADRAQPRHPSACVRRAAGAACRGDRAGGRRRSIFALPWLRRSLVGTTDETYEGAVEQVQPSEHDIDYLLSAVNEFFGVSMRREDVTGAYAGVRPLVSSGDSRRSVDSSGREELSETSSAMITITGGKLTTRRRMAKLAVDRLVARDGRPAPCRTQEIALGAPADPLHLPRVSGVAEEAYASLAGRYGFVARQVLELAARDCCCDGGEVAVRVAPTIGAALDWDALRVAAEAAGFADEARAEGIVVGA